MGVLLGYRLSAQQKRIESQGPGLEVFLRAEISGPFEMARLQMALADCFFRHEILRTQIRCEAGSAPLQVIQEGFAPELVTGPAPPGEALEVPRTRITCLKENLWVLELRLPAFGADPHTLGLVLDEVCRLYDRRPLDPEPFQFADFSDWQNDLHESEDSGLEFWRNRRLAPPILPVQHGKPTRPAFCRYSVGTSSLDCDQILGGWLALLQLKSGQEEVTVHTLVDGRIDTQFTGGMGPYAAQVPLTLSVGAEMTMALLGKRCREELDEAISMVEYLDYDPRLCPAGSFDFLVWPAEPLRQLGSASLKLRDRSCYYHAFAAQLVLEPSDGSYDLTLHWDANRLDEANARQLAQNLMVLLQGYQDTATLAELNLLENQQRTQLLFGFNQTQSSFPGDQTVHGMFEACVARRPQAIALVHRGESLTYEALDRWASGIASALRERGIAAEMPVGIVLGLVPALPAAILGILKSGACYVPFDPEYPTRRLFDMITDCGTPLLLVAADSKLEGCPSPLLEVEQFRAEQTSFASRVIDSGQLAYLMYTSGSTGQPKAVSVDHRALAHYLGWAISTYGPKLDAPVFSTPAADLSLTCLLAPLLSGDTVTLLESYALKDLPNMHRNHPFSLIKATPSHLKVLSSYLDPSQQDLGCGCLVLGGEALFEEDVRLWRSCFPNWRIVNEYGPSEATVGCCTHEVAEKSGAVAIGRPIANTQLFVLDAQMRPLPPGLPGELYIGGVCLARGYLRRPSLTAERFVPHPFSSQPGERLYRSGDRVLFSCAQPRVLEYLGRRDDQVKIKGFRVELGEVAAVLKRQAGLGEVFVDLVEGRIVAYFSAPQQHFVDQLREILAPCLSEPMIPSYFIALDRLPLTSNGKVDRARLPKPDQARPALSSLFEPPSSALEVTLAELWRDALNQENIGIHDNFFSLGGDSIRTVRVAASAAKLGLALTVQDMFRFPTIAQLAHYLEPSMAARDDDAALFARIENMSDEEAKELLAQMEGGGSP